jgi:hypothetical protein
VLFSGIKGQPLRRSKFNKITRRVHLVAVAGMPGSHLHDLRHTGNMLAAATGATTKDLTRRMGHDTERAALIYQHATNKADQMIAKGLDVLLKARVMEKAQCKTGRHGPYKRSRPGSGQPSDLAFAMRTGDGNRTRQLGNQMETGRQRW